MQVLWVCAGAAAVGAAYLVYQHTGRVADVELHLQVKWDVPTKSSEIKEVVVRVWPERVDLTAHQGLLELPEMMRGWATFVRDLRVASCELRTLPVWMGELANLEVLCVDGIFEGRRLTYGCPLQALPAGLWKLTALHTLHLSRCQGLTVLPAALGELVALRHLSLTGCDGSKALPAEL